MLDGLKKKVTAILSPPILSKTFLSIGKSMVWIFTTPNLNLKKITDPLLKPLSCKLLVKSPITFYQDICLTLMAP